MLIPMFLTMFGVCLLRIAWVLIVLPMQSSLETIIVSYPITWTVTAVFFLVYYRYRIKKLRVRFSGFEKKEDTPLV